MKKALLKLYLEHGLSFVGTVVGVLSVVLLFTDAISEIRGYAGIGLAASLTAIDIARSAWVVSERSSAMWDGTYQKLPCFDEMCSIFWVWDLEKFINRDYFGANMFDSLKENG